MFSIILLKDYNLINTLEKNIFYIINIIRLIMKLSDKDYYKILDFYNISYSDKTSIKTIRKRAEKALAEKLCRCIKKSEKNRLGIRVNNAR